MNWSFLFFFNSILLGAGLAMDAFSVSMANGLNEPKMSRKRMFCIAGTFAVFQAFMPMTGWVIFPARWIRKKKRLHFPMNWNIFSVERKVTKRT